MVIKKSNLKADHFNYILPKDLIAQNPASPRDSCKLLIYDSKKDKVYHEKFSDIGKFLNKGDCLVVNSSKNKEIKAVIPPLIVKLFEFEGIITYLKNNGLSSLKKLFSKP